MTEEENKTCECKEKKKSKKESKELEEAKLVITELSNKLMYAQAENINYRKRKEEETANMLKYANQDLLLELVNMLDNLDRAAKLKVESEESKKIQAGINLVNNQFKDILAKYNVQEIDAKDKEFDEDYMEAMMIGNDPSKPNNIVLDVLMKGYMYKDRVLKHAVVKVNQIENNDNEKGND